MIEEKLGYKPGYLIPKPYKTLDRREACVLMPLISSVLGEWKEKKIFQKPHGIEYIRQESQKSWPAASVSESKSKMKAICCIAKLLQPGRNFCQKSLTHIHSE